MHTLLLVDDEENVLKGIQAVFDLEKLGFALVGAYTRPLDALAQLKELSPDLIITDIKMPRMDGLEFAGKAKQILPGAEIVILSGHGEFAYAQTAIHLGIADYVLKPVKKPDFEAMLGLMNQRINRKKQDIVRSRELSDAYESNLQNRRNRLFHELLAGLQDEEYWQKQSVAQALGFQAESYLLIKMIYRSVTGAIDMSTFVASLEQSVVRELNATGATRLFHSDEYAYLVLDRPDGDMKQLKRWLSVVFSKFEDGYGIGCTVAVSNIHSGWSDFFAAEMECDEALMEAFLNEQSLGLACERMVATNNVQFSGGELENLMIAVNLHDRSQADRIIDRIFRPSVAGRSGVDYLYSLALIILIKLAELPDRGRDVAVPMAKHELTFSHLKKRFQSIGQLKDFVAGRVVAGMGEGEALAPTTVGKIVANVVRHVNEHIDQEIPLNEIAKAVNVSKNYLCFIFKKEMGTTLLNYIVDARMRIAKELLREGALKMYEIAERVGYLNYAYFSQLFKKHTGLTLSEYRNSVK